MKHDALYNVGFNANEWFALGMIALGATGMALAPKRFTPTQALFNASIGVFLAHAFDHTLALPPFDYYDLNDRSAYELFDFISYAMYAPYGYFYIYLAQRFRIRGFLVIPYIAVWVCLAAAVEWCSLRFGLFHYKHGYILAYSIPIYAFLQTLHLTVYRRVFERPSVGPGE